MASRVFTNLIFHNMAGARRIIPSHILILFIPFQKKKKKGIFFFSVICKRLHLISRALDSYQRTYNERFFCERLENFVV